MPRPTTKPKQHVNVQTHLTQREHNTFSVIAAHYGIARMRMYAYALAFVLDHRAEFVRYMDDIVLRMKPYDPLIKPETSPDTVA